MPARRWLTVFVPLVAGLLTGATLVVIGTEVNQSVSSDSFCTSCHTMAVVAADLHYRQSAHESNAAGLRVRCSDCHSPRGNWFEETYSHVRLGIKDTLAEYMNNFDDLTLWNKRRGVLAVKVREEMQRNDSITCRTCHNAAFIRPASEAGRAAHAALKTGGPTCIDCHANLVHTPVAAGTALDAPALSKPQ